ncbi:MAG: tyrosine phenol-lyase [Elusimicrobia bacterium CG11_big_fil_rev_8_21_14_0_20_64_6]|nr:MAG: tyrosine phenol-lyase [Elusimicrobia bacterium CG11_big_fil_rev_8_21_14_0_20_64_6]
MEPGWKTIIEPFKIKSVEPLGFTTRAEREKVLRAADYNLFSIPADKVLIDLLTDSGTSAMSAEQWSALMRGDESYAGARSFFELERTVRDLTGLRYVMPVHQGRAAERVLFSVAGGKGKVVLSNSHFDTTRANVEASGAEAIDLPVPEALDFATPGDFKGDIDLRALEAKLRELGRERVTMIVMTLTNNSLGGQPVSMANLRATAEIARHYRVPLFLDIARFAENAWFIKLRESGYATRPVREIVREIFSYADGCWMSAKKDAFVNIGGFLALNDEKWMNEARETLILGEGFTTYGGLAGRDLEAMAVGLREVLDEHYLEYRIRSIEYLGNGLRSAGVPIVEPPGGHAVYLDARRLLTHIAPEGYPAQALACELYLTAGVRSVEIGSLMFGRRENGAFIPAHMELVRLAIPRRVYTQSHMDFLIEVVTDAAKRAKSIRPLRLLSASPRLAHFTAKLEPEVLA